MMVKCMGQVCSISLCFINTSRVLTRNANALMEARCIKQVNCFMDEVI